MAALPPNVRAHLEWSWNFVIAQSWEDESTRHVAQAITSGITPGSDADDQSLVYDFLISRTESLNPLVIDPVWALRDERDSVVTTDELLTAIRAISKFDEVWAESPDL